MTEDEYIYAGDLVRITHIKNIMRELLPDINEYICEEDYDAVYRILHTVAESIKNYSFGGGNMSKWDRISEWLKFNILGPIVVGVTRSVIFGTVYVLVYYISRKIK